ncbi:beta-N-acetylhexosaminidase [Agromyces albus]|uniref:beta-N-acetylhexosaminidase n=1 Tax=Agromyces albus TaxID=205332 RepID=UPI0027844B98|nr:beta-N-acetylhexosaminidase [Agromyces albus]MDQ0576242.1 hexosaminidase [Agromyces albus]
MKRRTAWVLAAVLMASATWWAGAALIAPPPAPAIAVVPQPVEVIGVRGDAFRLGPDVRIMIDGDPREAGAVARQLADLLRPASGFELPIVRGEAEPGDIAFVLAAGEAPDGHAAEGYRLRADESGVRISATTAAGLSNGMQSLRQLLPADVEGGQLLSDPLEVVAVEISDYPRFAYRSAMLDVARHFFSIEEVERFIDEIAMLKINTLHMHLSNDHGWRIEIEGWPLLTEVGGLYEVDGGPGGFYTQEEFAGIIDYAAERNVTIVPEANMPGHVHAALTAYPELTCDGVARQPHTPAAGGGSTLCPTSVDAERLAEDVIRQLAALTPGPYLHLGGDEVFGYTEEEYTYFMELTSRVAEDEGKTVVGWQEVGASDALPIGTIGQYWGSAEPDELDVELMESFLDQGGAIVMSPSDVAYLDQVYPDRPADSRLGLSWAGPTGVADAYDWDPARIFEGVGDDQVLGIEAPLWSETLTSIDDVEFMAFPRLGSLAEVGWSPAPANGEHRDFDEFALRLVTFLERFEELDVNFHRSSDLPW